MRERMMKLVLASRNKKKIEELRTLLCEEFENVEILSLDDVGITGEIEEDGITFEENALIKARVAATSGYIGVADDSGISVDALGGEPGVYSARYAAKCNFAGDHDDEGNNQCLLYNLRNVPEAERTGGYVCEEFGKTFAEITAEEKHTVSHRGKAIRAFAKTLKELL